jgi:hypothetical protein
MLVVKTHHSMLNFAPIKINLFFLESIVSVRPTHLADNELMV